MSEKFFLAEGVSGISREDVHRSLLQLALDGTKKDEERFPGMLLEGGGGVVTLRYLAGLGGRTGLHQYGSSKESNKGLSPGVQATLMTSSAG